MFQTNIEYENKDDRVPCLAVQRARRIPHVGDVGRLARFNPLALLLQSGGVAPLFG